MKLLAIETATEACSAALLINGEITQRYQIAPREHARMILTMVDELMADAQLKPTQLDALAFGRGPGSFIGVRIAAGIIQGIGYAADLPVAPVSTLAAMAQGSGYSHVLAAIDARMGEVYWGQFERQNESVIATIEERLCKPDDASIEQPGQYDWVGVGTGWQTYRDRLVSRLPQATPSNECLYPFARSIAELAVSVVAAGLTVSPEQALPVYLRDKVAEKPS